MRQKLTEQEINERLNELEAWQFIDGQIAKTFEFDCYQKGLVFATHVGYLADQMDHHPDLFIGYRKVRVSINTHDVGGISNLDFELAQKIDRLS